MAHPVFGTRNRKGALRQVPPQRRTNVPDTFQAEVGILLYLRSITVLIDASERWLQEEIYDSVLNVGTH
jgi:hypothetical protein